MNKIIIITEDVCAERIFLEVDDRIIKTVEFEGGCDGNSKALGILLAGMSVEEAVEKLSGVDCDGKGTSCADQLAKGLKRELLDKNKA